jgi:7,8-dihydropterin-6-yl-methyl-4-(beta-D-ribofuranosyl)aminobenzene 5'-phosphate synthase
VNAQGSIQLESVDALDVTIVVHNTIDILAANTDVAQRSPLAWEWSEREQLRAEHGYALWVTSCNSRARPTVAGRRTPGSGTTRPWWF